MLQFSAENGRFQKSGALLPGKEDAVRVQGERAGERKRQADGEEKFFSRVSRIICTGGKLRPARLRLRPGKRRIGQHGQDGKHAEDIVGVVQEHGLKEPFVPADSIFLIQRDQLTAGKGIGPVASQKFLQSLQPAAGKLQRVFEGADLAIKVGLLHFRKGAGQAVFPASRLKKGHVEGGSVEVKHPLFSGNSFGKGGKERFLLGQVFRQILAEHEAALLLKSRADQIQDGGFRREARGFDIKKNSVRKPACTGFGQRCKGL